MRIPEPTSGEVRWTFRAVGVVAIIFALALGYGIVHKVNQSDDIVRIAAAEANQVDRLTSQLEAQNQMAAQRAKSATRDRAEQTAQIRRLQRLVAILAKSLKANGIAVPSGVFSTPKGGSTTRPKVPHRPRSTNPATPTPTAPSPTADPTCLIVPQLCGLPLGLPTLLP